MSLARHCLPVNEQGIVSRAKYHDLDRAARHLVMGLALIAERDGLARHCLSVNEQGIVSRAKHVEKEVALATPRFGAQPDCLRDGLARHGLKAETRAFSVALRTLARHCLPEHWLGIVSRAKHDDLDRAARHLVMGLALIAERDGLARHCLSVNEQGIVSRAKAS